MIEREDLEDSATLQDKLEYASRRVRRLGLSGACRVLEVGCGSGRFAIALAMVNHAVYALDVRVESLSLLYELACRRNLANIHLVQGSLVDLPFPDNSFDIVFSYQSVNYVSDYIGLPEMLRVLQPGGRLYINTCGLGMPLHRSLVLASKKRRIRFVLGGLRILFNTLLLEPLLQARGTTLYTAYYSAKYERILRGVCRYHRIQVGADCELGADETSDIEVEQENPSRFLGLRYGVEILIEK